MTRDEVVAQVRFNLGNRMGLDDQIVQALQSVQQEYESRVELPGFLKTFSELTVAENGTGPMPTGFLRFVEINPVQIITNGYITDYPSRVPLPLHSEVLDTYGPAYDYTNLTFYLYPVGTETTIRIFYYKKADLLTTNIENSWLLNVPTLFALESTSRLAGSLDEVGLKTLFADDLAKEQRAYRDRIWRDKHQGMLYTLE